MADPQCWRGRRPGARCLQVQGWETSLDHYVLFGIDDLEKGATAVPQFVEQFGSFSSLLARDGGASSQGGPLGCQAAPVCPHDRVKRGFRCPQSPPPRRMVRGHRRQEVQQAVKNACDQLNSDGVNVRDYVEQLAWLFFEGVPRNRDRLEEESGVRGDSEIPAGSAANSLVRLGIAHRQARRGRRVRQRSTLGQADGDGQGRGVGDDAVGEIPPHLHVGAESLTSCAAFARTVEQVNRLHFSDESDVIVLSELYENLLKQVAAEIGRIRGGVLHAADTTSPWSKS